jgi:membrane protein insertase Oxa1/YidC/SpoIIIJ
MSPIIARVGSSSFLRGGGALSPKYNIIPNVTSVNEGASVTFNITATNAPDGTYYWTTLVNSGTVNSSDFDDGETSGTVTLTGGIGSVTRTLSNDVTTEGSESFSLELRQESVSGTIVATSVSVTIGDTSQTPEYSITPSSSSVNEGSSVTFNVATSNVADGTVLYWTTNIVSGTINTSDFSDGFASGSVVISSGTASIVREISADFTTEGSESFQVELRIGSVSGDIVATSTTVTIGDTSLTPTYSVTPNTSSVNEGSSVVFTVNTTNVPDGTTLYWSTNTVSGTVNTSDFNDFATTGSFTITSNTGSVTRTLSSDTTTEGSESFQLQIRTGSISGTVVATSSTVTINDTSLTPVPTYAVATSCFSHPSCNTGDRSYVVNTAYNSYSCFRCNVLVYVYSSSCCICNNPEYPDDACLMSYYWCNPIISGGMCIPGTTCISCSDKCFYICGMCNTTGCLFVCPCTVTNPNGIPTRLCVPSAVSCRSNNFYTSGFSAYRYCCGSNFAQYNTCVQIRWTFPINVSPQSGFSMSSYYVCCFCFGYAPCFGSGGGCNGASTTHVLGFMAKACSTCNLYDYFSMPCFCWSPSGGVSYGTFGVTAYSDYGFDYGYPTFAITGHQNTAYTSSYPCKYGPTNYGYSDTGMNGGFNPYICYFGGGCINYNCNIGWYY